MDKPLDILCYYDQNHQILYDYFFYFSYSQYIDKTNFLLKPQVIKSNNTDSSYLSSHWSEMLIARYDFLLSYIDTHKDHWAIFSDVDVVFLDDISKSVNSLIKNQHSIEIFYMKEAPYISRNKEVNGGFFIFKCSDLIRKFFSTIQQCTKQMSQPNDQICINKLLTEEKISFGFLPPEEFLTNNGRMDTTKRYVSKNITKVLHATSSYDLNSKIQILSSALIYKYKYNKEYKKSNYW